MDMDERAYAFWQRVDAGNRKATLLDLCKSVGLDYNRVKHNRSDCRVPKADDLLLLAKALNTSIEFLLTGMDPWRYPPRIEAIISRCLIAPDDDLRLVEKVLGIEEKKAASSAG